MIDNCTRCNKKFTDLKITIAQMIETERVKENGVLEKLPNLNVVSREILCKECFDLYAETMSDKMNIQNEER